MRPYRITIDTDPRGHVPKTPTGMTALCGARARSQWQQHTGALYCEECIARLGEQQERPRPT